MERRLQDEQPVLYGPAIAVTRITAKQTLARVPFVRINEPRLICGIAKRVGYTGREETDLALYRLKLKTKRGRMQIMLPSLFVVEGGVFLDYECWLSQPIVGERGAESDATPSRH